MISAAKINDRTWLVFALCFMLCLPLSGWCRQSDSLPVRTQDSSLIRPRHFIVPAGMLIYGFSAIHLKPLNRLDRHIQESVYSKHADFHSNIDDYLRYSPVFILYGLKLAGVDSKHSLKDQTGILLLSAAINFGGTGLMKQVVGRTRPNALDNKSFPSGHTTLAFMGAEIIHQEYGDESIVYTLLGYSLATATGVSRLYNNAHWFSDVVAGAGYGILSAKLAYWAYPKLRKLVNPGKGGRLLVSPSFRQHYQGLSLVYRLP